MLIYDETIIEYDEQTNKVVVAFEYSDESQDIIWLETIGE